MACSTWLINVRELKSFPCSTVETYHQLQYLNIFAESKYHKRGNCLPGTAAQANSSLSKKGDEILL